MQGQLVSLRLALFFLLLPLATHAFAQSREDQVIHASATVLDEIMAVPAKGIPRSLLNNAQGMVIVPNMIKGGFVIGVRHGRGTVIVRDEQGHWQPPQFVTMTGGSFGWQAGVQSTDVVLVFKSKNSVQSLLTGKFTLGVDAAASAGPVGRQASAGTDLQLKSEIYSYNRSRGLFLGASLDGSALQVDQLANQNYYALTPTTGALPQSSGVLLGTLTKYTAQPTVVPQQPLTSVVVPNPTPVMPAGAVTGPQPTIDPIGVLRDQLASSSAQLGNILDEQWRTYLALPVEVFRDGPHPHPSSLQRSITHFDAVAEQAIYSQLVQRNEFQTVSNLLKQYLAALVELEQRIGTVTLPPPPPAQ
ncbi:MAG: YSC84-related protein [Pirellulales bacterium]